MEFVVVGVFIFVFNFVLKMFNLFFLNIIILFVVEDVFEKEIVMDLLLEFVLFDVIGLFLMEGGFSGI